VDVLAGVDEERAAATVDPAAVDEQRLEDFVADRVH
jgi:hypothetical protein